MFGKMFYALKPQIFNKEKLVDKETFNSDWISCYKFEHEQVNFEKSFIFTSKNFVYQSRSAVQLI